jgi:hypothetical protein
MLTLKDLRVAKVDKRPRLQPCNNELSAYLAALESFQEYQQPINPDIIKMMNDCMNDPVRLFFFFPLIFLICNLLDQLSKADFDQISSEQVC